MSCHVDYIFIEIYTIYHTNLFISQNIQVSQEREKHKICTILFSIRLAIQIGNTANEYRVNSETKITLEKIRHGGSPK